MNIYLILFGIGVVFVIASFFLDAVLDVESPLPLLQPKLIAVFITVVGAVGLVLSARFESTFAAGIIMVISIVGGLVIAGIINRLVVIPLNKAQNTSAHDKQAVIGTVAKVISPIPAGGYGKIRYSVSGSTVTSPAKSEDGGAIKNGENVAIVYIEGGTYFVKHSVVLNSN